MDLTVTMLVSLVVVVSILFWYLWRRYTFSLASKTAQILFPVWAGQGPFENGTESAKAFKAAYIAVMGIEKAEDYNDAIVKHQVAYDQDPEKWENLRKKSMQESNEINDYVIVAKGITAMKVIHNDILTDEEINERKAEIGGRICESVGRNIMADNTPESLALMTFLSKAFEYSYNRPAESAGDYGYVWSLFIGHREKEPDDPASIDFNLLNEAWLSQHTPLDS